MVDPPGQLEVQHGVCGCRNSLCDLRCLAILGPEGGASEMRARWLLLLFLRAVELGWGSRAAAACVCAICAAELTEELQNRSGGTLSRPDPSLQ